MHRCQYDFFIYILCFVWHGSLNGVDCSYGYIQYSTSSPRHKKSFLFGHLFSIFEYNKRLLRRKTGGACLYMPQDGHWLASFEVIPPPSPKKIAFPRRKKWKFPTENGIAHAHFWKKNIRPKLFSSFCWLCLSEILSRRCRPSRTTSDPAQKSGKSGQNLRFSCFSGEKNGTSLSRRSRLSRTSRAPSRLSRPRPIDCDKEPKQTVKIFSGFWPILFSNIVNFF